MKISILMSLFLITSVTFAKEHIVEMLNKDGAKSMIFKPSFLKAKLGDTVRFKPSSKGHNTQSIFTPKSVKGWVGEVSQPLVIKLEKRGVYVYECKNHSIMGMVGVIQVGNLKKNKKAKKFLKTFKNKVVINKNCIDELIQKLD